MVGLHLHVGSWGIAMDLPVRCVHCNTVFSSGLILPSEYLFKNKIETITNASGASIPICLRCGRSSGPESRQESGDLFKILMGMPLSAAELEKLRAVLLPLIKTKISEEAAKELLTKNPKLHGIAKMLPRGQANVIAFLALVVALLTLVESIIADWPSLSKILSPESRSNGSTPSPTTHAHGSHTRGSRRRIFLDHPRPGTILHSGYNEPIRWDGEVQDTPGYVLCEFHYYMQASSRKRFYGLRDTYITNGTWHVAEVFRSQFPTEFKSLRNFFVMGFMKQRTWDRLWDSGHLLWDGFGGFLADASTLSFAMIHPPCVRFWVIPIAPGTGTFVRLEYLPEVRIPLSFAFD